MSTTNITESAMRQHVREMVTEALRTQRENALRQRVQTLVENTLRDMVRSGMLTEAEADSKGDDSKRKSVMTMLRDSKFNHAQLMRDLWHPSSKEEEDTLRSLFSKCATGTPDADGAVRSFSEEEINKLYELLRKH